MGQKFFQLPFPTIKNLMGEVPIRSGIALVGDAKVGKSILATQLAAMNAEALGGGVIILNTEKPSTTLYDLWMKRLGWTDYGVVECLSAEEFLKYLGIDITLNYDKKKIAIEINDIDPMNSRLKEKLEDGVKVVVFDSITTPFDILAETRQDYPVRHSAQKYFLSSLRMLLKEYSFAHITTHHATYDPTQEKYITTHDSKGGKAIHHGFEYVLYLRPSKSNRYNRLIYIMRHPTLPDFTPEGGVKAILDENGWREYEEE